jgi:hypothetical protein
MKFWMHELHRRRSMERRVRFEPRQVTVRAGGLAKIAVQSSASSGSLVRKSFKDSQRLTWRLAAHSEYFGRFTLVS